MDAQQQQDEAIAKKKLDDKSEARLRSPAWRDSLVQRVMDRHGFDEKTAIKEIIKFGG